MTIESDLISIKNSLKEVNTRIKRERLERFMISEINDIHLQKQIIKEFIGNVQIEIHSRCNRQCWWCGNSMIDRHTKQVELPEDLFLNILSQLKEIDYDGVICLSKYNESMIDKDLLCKRCRQVKEYLPRTYIVAISNGDFLTKEGLFEAFDSGLDKLEISLYYKDKEYDVFDADLVRANIKRFLKKIDLESFANNIEVTPHDKNKNSYYSSFIYPQGNKKVLLMKNLNFKTNAATMGGIIKESPYYETHQLYYPCDMPFQLISIEYTGNMTTCCNIRGDFKEHECFLIGNVNEKSIYELFFCEKAARNRRELLYFGKKEYPCKDCVFNCTKYKPIVSDAVFLHN
jgi:MoaA/NifB/PqqE/SkfB family radical SAM enzyme